MALHSFIHSFNGYLLIASAILLGLRLDSLGLALHCILKCWFCRIVSLYTSVQFSRLVVSNSLQPHESQHARPPCPSPTPGVHLDSHPSSWWCSVLQYLLEFAQIHVYWVGDAIWPSHPLLPPSPPALNPSQHQGLFQRVNSLHQVARVLEL